MRLCHHVLPVSFRGTLRLGALHRAGAQNSGVAPLGAFPLFPPGGRPSPGLLFFYLLNTRPWSLSGDSADLDAGASVFAVGGPTAGFTATSGLEPRVLLSGLEELEPFGAAEVQSERAGWRLVPDSVSPDVKEVGGDKRASSMMFYLLSYVVSFWLTNLCGTTFAITFCRHLCLSPST